MQNSCYWLIYDGLKDIIAMNLYSHLESDKERIDKKIHFIIDNKQCTCDHSVLYPMISRKGKYIPENAFIK